VGDALLAHRNAENGDLMLQIIAYSPVQFYKATAIRKMNSAIHHYTLLCGIPT